MAITNEQANLIIDQSVRPIAEKLRAAQAIIDSVLSELSVPDVSTFFDYAGEGVSSTYSDLRGNTAPRLANANTIFMFRSRLLSLKTLFDGVGFMDEINYLSVRPLRVE